MNNNSGIKYKIGQPIQEVESKAKTPFNLSIPDVNNPYNNLNMNAEKTYPEYYNKENNNYSTSKPSNIYQLLCSHCKTPIQVEPEWNMFECPMCHRLNKMPQKLINELYFADKLQNVKYNSYKNHLDMILPLAYVVAVCPLCKAENKVMTEATHFVCFICGNSFNLSHKEEEIQKKEKCSLNPNSKYYRNFSANPHPFFPVSRVQRVYDKLFPEPVCYDNVTVNPGTMGMVNLSNSEMFRNYNYGYPASGSQKIITFGASNFNNPSVGYDKTGLNSTEDILGINGTKQLKDIFQKRESQRAEIYKSLFFMNH